MLIRSLQVSSSTLLGVTKFVSHGYKVRERMLVITDSSIHALDVKDGKAKHRMPLNVIITITNGAGSLLLIRIPEEGKRRWDSRVQSF
jgi:hypothetical protein